MLAHFEITDEDEIRQISRGLRRAEDADAPAEVPEEYTSPEIIWFLDSLLNSKGWRSTITRLEPIAATRDL